MTSTSSPTARPSGPVGPPPPFDPECAAVLAPMAEMLTAVRITADLIPAMRTAVGIPRPTADELSRGGAFTVEERTVPGPAGAPEISLLVCRPTAAPAPVPVVYTMHGGGMIVGNNGMGVDDALDWAQELGTAVVSVEYRLAPETPHPGPVEDCYAGLSWTVEHAAELGLDPARVVVAGQSAGGGLAAALALMARDRGGPALLGQLLLCPMLDDRNDTPSARQMAGVGLWDRDANQTGWTALLGDACGGPDVSPYAAPARATDLSALPPAFIEVGSAETFRDEDVTYAGRIWQAGGVAELHVWQGAFHGFTEMAPDAQVSRDARAARLQWLRRLLAS